MIEYTEYDLTKGEKEILDLYKVIKEVKKISQIKNCSKSYIYRVLRKLGQKKVLKKYNKIYKLDTYLFCSSYEHIEKHHILPKSSGGKVKNNIISLCYLCHKKLHVEIIEPMLKKLKRSKKLTNNVKK